VDRKDLHALSRVRLREAKALIGLRLHDGAFYLAGYAVECALKACIAKGTRRHEFPDKEKVDKSYTHSLKALVKLANLEDARREEATRDATFLKNWDLVESWSEQSRYRASRPEQARALIEAVGNRNHGVLRWIKRFW
jgi:HEPN domain-containing protein